MFLRVSQSTKVPPPLEEFSEAVEIKCSYLRIGWLIFGLGYQGCFDDEYDPKD
jgi:hypothetical protein